MIYVAYITLDFEIVVRPVSLYVYMDCQASDDPMDELMSTIYPNNDGYSFVGAYYTQEEAFVEAVEQWINSTKLVNDAWVWNL